MKTIQEYLRGLALCAGLLPIVFNGYAQTQSTNNAAIDTKAWLQTFDNPIGDAYVLKPLSAFKDGPTISDIYIEVIHKKTNTSELVAFQDRKALGRGCFINSDSEEERPQHVSCQKQAHRNIAQNKLQLPKCHLDKDDGGYPRTATYFTTHQGTRAICIYKMPTQLDEFVSKPQKKSSDDLLVINIEPIWKVDQQEEVRLDNTGLLTHFFLLRLFNSLTNWAQIVPAIALVCSVFWPPMPQRVRMLFTRERPLFQ